MTRAPINYKNGKIYKIEPIIDHDEDDIYIGSTTKQYLSQRMTAHHRLYNQYKNNKTNHTTSFLLFDKYGLENCNIILLELVEANSKDELHQREAHYIKTLKCVNKKIPLQTRNEYIESNKEILKNRMKEYREQNKEQLKEKRKLNKDRYKDKIKETKKIYNELNKDKIKETRKKYNELNKDKIKEKMKEYQQNNKDKIKQHKLKYYYKNKDNYNELNKDKIKETRKIYYETHKTQYIFCECCNKNINKLKKQQHYKTQLHIKNSNL